MSNNDKYLRWDEIPVGKARKMLEEPNEIEDICAALGTTQVQLAYLCRVKIFKDNPKLQKFREQLYRRTYDASLKNDKTVKLVMEGDKGLRDDRAAADKFGEALKGQKFEDAKDIEPRGQLYRAQTPMLRSPCGGWQL